ncbi:unnamed protein product, partial [Citrullus colocynthis]
HIHGPSTSDGSWEAVPLRPTCALLKDLAGMFRLQTLDQPWASLPSVQAVLLDPFLSPRLLTN